MKKILLISLTSISVLASCSAPWSHSPSVEPTTLPEPALRDAPADIPPLAQDKIENPTASGSGTRNAPGDKTGSVHPTATGAQTAPTIALTGTTASSEADDAEVQKTMKEIDQLFDTMADGTGTAKK